MADLVISQPMTFTVDVKTGLVERPQRESLMRGDRYANRIIVELVDGSEPFDITGVTVKGEFCKPPNGDAINLPGEAKDNVAEVQLTDQCYTAGGHYEARVILVLGEVERTVLFISGDVLKSGSGNAAGEEPIPGGGGGTGGGLPAGGTAGQVLVKVSSAQGDAIWKTLTAEDVGARPNTWTPTAEDVGARPDNWTPTAADVGALPSGGTAVNANALNGKSADYYAKASDIALMIGAPDYRNAVALVDETPNTATDTNLKMTMEADGYVVCVMNTSATKGAIYIQMLVNGTNIGGYTYGDQLTSYMIRSTPLVPVKSGDEIECLLSITDASSNSIAGGRRTVRFIPAKTGA